MFYFVSNVLDICITLTIFAYHWYEYYFLSATCIYDHLLMVCKYFVISLLNLPGKEEGPKPGNFSVCY
jgi:hypothetical protein